MDAFSFMLIFILGIVIGSLINVAIFRLEKKEGMSDFFFRCSCYIHRLKQWDYFSIWNRLLSGGRRNRKKKTPLQYQIGRAHV